MKNTTPIPDDHQRLPNGKLVPKEDHYGWSQPGPEPDFQWIHKNKLTIDTEHIQRHQVEDRVLEIASKFSWAMFIALVVVRRPDGVLSVVEGGTRLRAARKRTDITTVPCLVFDINSLSEEARLFYRLNTERTKVGSRDQYKALLTAGDELALKLKQLVEGAGYSVESTATTKAYAFDALETLLRLLRQNEAAARNTFHALAKAAKGARIDNDCLKGLYYVATRAEGEVFSAQNVERLEDTGIAGIRKAIKEREALTQKGGEKTAGWAVLDLLNHRRHRKLVFTTP
jgi:hypothetical protein